MNTDTKQIILDKIKTENIKPRARWYFVLSHLVLWVPGVMVTAFGAVAVAGELYAISHAGWEYREFVYPSALDFFVATVPFVWVLSFALFASLIVRAFRATHTGYRFSTKVILLGSVVTSVTIGTLTYILDDTLQADTFIRYPVHVREQKIWFSPNDGRLAGFIETKREGELILRDRDGMLWVIDLSGFGTTTFPFTEEGRSVRIIGTSTDEHVFEACAIFPWEIGGFPPRTVSTSSLRVLPRMHQSNANPDCTILLEGIKEHVRRH